MPVKSYLGVGDPTTYHLVLRLAQRAKAGVLRMKQFGKRNACGHRNAMAAVNALAKVGCIF